MRSGFSLTGSIVTGLLSVLIYCVVALVAQSCPTLCNPTDCNLAGSAVCEIILARVLEWVAIPFSGVYF